jgi:hypothetical protein
LFDGSYLLEYYLYDIPFIFVYAALCFVFVKEKPRPLLYIYFPLFLLIVLAIYWNSWGIGPDYSWRIQLNSIIIDVFSHGLLFYSVYFISKRLINKKSKLWLYILLYLLYFILALIVIQIMVFAISWLLQMF